MCIEYRINITILKIIQKMHSFINGQELMINTKNAIKNKK